MTGWSVEILRGDVVLRENGVPRSTICSFLFENSPAAFATLEPSTRLGAAPNIVVTLMNGHTVTVDWFGAVLSTSRASGS